MLMKVRKLTNETKVTLSSQALDHWKANYNCIIVLHNFSIQPSPADIEFLKSELPDPCTILMALLFSVEIIVQQSIISFPKMQVSSQILTCSFPVCPALKILI